MKVMKISQNHGRITREVISNFGQSLYKYDEVKTVLIKVKFKDGCEIGFKRDEEEDELEEFFKEKKSSSN